MNKKEVLLATRNPGKLKQIQKIFKDSSLNILTLDDVGIEGEAVEDGRTLLDNAFLKALFAFHNSDRKIVVMSDDSGIFIDALDGLPGVKSARWAGDVSTKEITEHTLSELKGLENRKAVFKAVVIVFIPKNDKKYDLLYFRGETKGYLKRKAVTDPEPGMPYNPIFVPEGENKVWAEMTTEQQNETSHRNKAFQKALGVLKEVL